MVNRPKTLKIAKGQKDKSAHRYLSKKENWAFEIQTRFRAAPELKTGLSSGFGLAWHPHRCA